MKGRLFCLAVLTVLMLAFFSVHPSFAQGSDDLAALMKDVESLKAGQQAIEREIQSLKKLLLAQQSPPAAQQFSEMEVDVDHSPVRGDKDARVALLEFSDYECPFCSRFVRSVLPQLDKEYIDAGKVKLIFMNFPLPMHSHAKAAAEAAECAGDQGKYWQMHDKLFANQRQQSEEDLTKYADALGLDVKKFKDCLHDGRHDQQIQRDTSEGVQAGINGTPCFLLGYVERGGKVKAVKRIVGVQPYASYKTAIDELLAAKN
jgi:protein-disulfide isomerase